MAEVLLGPDCPEQSPTDSEQTYCANHPGCCYDFIVLRRNTEEKITVNPYKYEVPVDADKVFGTLPPWRVLAPGVVAEIDQATLDGYRAEYDALGGQFSGAELIDKQAAFFAKRGMLLHQQSVLGAKKDTTSTLKRAELLYQIGFYSVAIRVVNTVIKPIEKTTNKRKRADLARALEIGGRSFQALCKLDQAQEAFLRMAEARIGM